MFWQGEYQRSFDRGSRIELNAACQQEVAVAAHAAVDYLHATAFTPP